MAEQANAEAGVIEVKHIAAVVGKDVVTRATRREIKGLEEAAKKVGEKKALERYSVGDESLAEPNLSDINEARDKLPDDDSRRDQLDEQKNHLEDINKGERLDTATVTAVGKAFANIPGFCEAIAYRLSVGAANVSAENVKQALINGDLSRYRGLEDIIRNHAESPRFRDRLKKLQNNLEYPSDLDETDAQIEDLKNKIDSQDRTTNRKKDTYTKAKDWWDNLAEPEKAEISEKISQRDSLIKQLGRESDRNTNPLSSSPTATEITTYIEELRTRIGGLTGNSAEVVRERSALNGLLTGAQRLQTLIDDPIFTDTLAEGFTARDGYYRQKEAETKLDEVKNEEAQISKDRASLHRLETKFKKSLDKYVGGVLGVINKGAIGYWNEDLLVEAGKLQGQEKVIKDEKESKSTNEKEKAKVNADQMLDMYLDKIVYEFVGDNIEGMDTGLIQRLNELVLKRSESQMVREVLKEMWKKRTRMPQTYKQEMEEVFKGYLKDKGVDINDTNLDVNSEFSKFISELDTTSLKSISAKHITKVLGYGMAHLGGGTWLSRPKFTEEQVGFLKQAYGPDFFVNAINQCEQYKSVLADVVGKGVLTTGAELKAWVNKNLMGKNAKEFMQNMFKALAIAGMIALVMMVIANVKH